MLAGCGDSDDTAGEGTVNATVYGESFIEDGIPASEMADGWSVSFHTFIVSVDQVTIAGVSVPTPGPIDISGSTQGAGHTYGSITVPAGTHAAPSYAIQRVEVSGVATKDGVTKNFSWTFDAPTTYTNCETSTTVAAQGSATFQVTVHADHLFYDSLVAEEPQVVFQALADADADNDGTITQQELAGAGLGSYDPGNADITNLWDYLVAQTRTLGHANGESHCDARAN